MVYILWLFDTHWYITLLNMNKLLAEFIKEWMDKLDFLNFFQLVIFHLFFRCEMDLKIHISNLILFCFLSFDLDMHLSLQGESPSFSWS